MGRTRPRVSERRTPRSEGQLRVERSTQLDQMPACAARRASVSYVSRPPHFDAAANDRRDRSQSLLRPRGSSGADGRRRTRSGARAFAQKAIVGVPERGMIAIEDDLARVERALYLTAAMTGLRQGELLALRWTDIDWRHSGSASDGTSSGANSARPSRSARPGRCRPRTASERSSRRCYTGRPTQRTRTSCSAIRTPDARSRMQSPSASSRRRPSSRPPRGAFAPAPDRRGHHRGHQSERNRAPTEAPKPL
jgi:hypothetical protein